MANIMRRFSISEISAVDRPAQAHAKVVLMKRASDQEFNEYLADELAAEVVKANAANAEETAMTEEIKKAVDAATVEIKKELDEAKAELAKKDSDLEAVAGDTKKPVFPKKKPAKNPDPDAADEAGEMMASKAFELPEEIKKAIDENASLRKRLESLEEEKEIVSFGKRAVSLGLSEPNGETLRKAYRGDAAAIKSLETLIKSLTAQIDASKLFGEIGSAQTGAGVTAKAEIDAKAAALREVEKGLSPAQAFVKVYTDPANAELKKAYDIEEYNSKRAIRG